MLNKRGCLTNRSFYKKLGSWKFIHAAFVAKNFQL